MEIKKRVSPVSLVSTVSFRLVMIIYMAIDGLVNPRCEEWVQSDERRLADGGKRTLAAGKRDWRVGGEQHGRARG